jgi:hypothetical protein
MDLFDFLYEIWKAKFLFVTIVAGFLAAGIASVLVEPDLSAFRSVDSTEAPGGRDYAEQALYRIRLSDKDPLQREADELVRDLVGRAYPELGLVQLDDPLLSEFFTATTEETMYFENAAQSLLLAVDLGAHADDFIDYGQIRALAAPGTIDLSTDLHATLRAAADRQLAAAVERMEREKALIDEVLETMPVPLVVMPNDPRGASGGAWVDWAAERVFDGEMFRSDPATQAEGFVLVEVLPPSDWVTGLGRLSDLVKAVVISGMLGLIVAVLTIMFRIGIRRGRGAGTA